MTTQVGILQALGRLQPFDDFVHVGERFGDADDGALAIAGIGLKPRGAAFGPHQTAQKITVEDPPFQFIPKLHDFLNPGLRTPPRLAILTCNTVRPGS